TTRRTQIKNQKCPHRLHNSSSPKKQTLFISSLIILWYTSNIGVLLLNKFLLSNYGFKFPIFLHYKKTHRIPTE
ncbi:unnamed protein product, partial [Brassica napus]